VTAVFAEKAFIGFAEVADPARHRDYNTWHQLDHRPENLALPGVLHGERWVRSPDCAAAGATPDPLLGGVHYLNMYWFRAPADESIRAWSELAERSFQWGRRPDVRWTRRPLMGFFRPIKGYVNPRVLVSADALPFRPNRGIFATVSRISEPRSEAAEELFGWYDAVRLPALLSCRGAAGAWTFASEDTFSSAHDLGATAAPPSLRVHLIFLDDDPLDFVTDVRAHDADWQRSGEHRDTARVETQLFAGPLRAIAPWQWDWFDTTADAAAGN
jgi:hypothetical protein